MLYQLTQALRLIRNYKTISAINQKNELYFAETGNRDFLAEFYFQFYSS